MSVYDFMLHRELLDGKEFDKLIPKAFMVSTEAGNGGTDLSMKLIKEVSDEFSWQMEDVAKVLQKKTLEETCQKIHWFAYWHHQYKADDDAQLMRSPSRSWQDRRIGIDCKSYSIIASCILSELGITHYIRKIKQPGMSPNDYTHVYVVVPKNQATGDLRDGHFTIDGTLKSTAEPSYLEKTDLKMQHQKLNAPYVQGLNGSVSLSTITGLFSSFGCIGGSGFTEGAYGTAQGSMNDYYFFLFKDINDAIAAKNWPSLSENIAEFFAVSKVSVIGYERKLADGWNPCTTKRLQGMVAMSKFYRDTVGAAVTAYLNQYFSKTPTGQTVMYHNGGMEEAPYGFKYIYTGVRAEITEPLQNFQVLPTVSTIPRLEITQYVVAANGTQLNAMEYLKTLTTALATFLPSSGGGTGNGTGGGTGNGDGYYVQPENNQSQAGFGSLVGWIVGAAALAVAFTKMPSTGSGSRKAPARTSSKTSKK